MNALGVTTDHKGAKISYDQFLRINSFLDSEQEVPCLKDDYIWFCVKLMDPFLTGFADTEHCEYVIELLFDNQDEDGNKTQPPKT